jgi:murein DD-endopeptidase MepM/ murein hydrolase activator NlpD
MLATLMFAWVSTPVSNAAVSAYSNPVLGVQVSHPVGTTVVEDQYLNTTFGFTIMNRPLSDTHAQFLLRVGQVQDSASLEQKVQELQTQFADLGLQQSPVTVGRHRGVAVFPVPGEYNENTYVYLNANGRLYEIIYGRGQLDDQGWALLKSARFQLPRQPLESLHLPKAQDVLRVTPPAAVLQAQAAPAQDGAQDTQPQMDAPAPFEPQAAQAQTDTTFATPQSIEPMAGPGCANWPSWKYLQTSWGRDARGTGWSKAGPSWYGEGGHVNCNSPSRLNDYHAVDFPLREWDSLYPPAPGRVIYAGWASGGWSHAGRVVIIDLGNGYWSGSFHMRSIAVSTGQYVTANTRIGYAGGSGNGRDGYFGNHLHQGLYYNAKLYASAGGVYGGQSVEPFYIHCKSDNGVYYRIARGAWMRY